MQNFWATLYTQWLLCVRAKPGTQIKKHKINVSNNHSNKHDGALYWLTSNQEMKIET